jgi:signal transduction histidine kinase
MLNSFDAMNECPSAERLTVITTCRLDSEVRAAVADSGQGISKEESEKIFNPFFTTKPQGLGIGLSICRSIILRHQGKLWVESKPGQGATFHFSLPAAPDERTPTEG